MNRGIRITPGKVLRSALRSVLDSSPKLVLRISLRWMAPRNDFDGGGFRKNSEAATERIPKNFSESFSKTNSPGSSEDG